MKLLLILISVLLISCSTTNTKQSSTPESAACKQARAQYGLCYFPCTGSTVGDYLNVANICTRQCRSEMRAIRTACR